MGTGYRVLILGGKRKRIVKGLKRPVLRPFQTLPTLDFCPLHRTCRARKQVSELFLRHLTDVKNKVMEPIDMIERP
jgi:hypothetical protein